MVRLLPVWQRKGLRGTEQFQACPGPHLVRREARSGTPCDDCRGQAPPWVPDILYQPWIPSFRFWLGNRCKKGQRALGGTLPSVTSPLQFVPSSESEDVVIYLHSVRICGSSQWNGSSVQKTDSRSRRTWPGTFPVCCLPSLGLRAFSLHRVAITHQEKLRSSPCLPLTKPALQGCLQLKPSVFR